MNVKKDERKKSASRIFWCWFAKEFFVRGHCGIGVVAAAAATTTTKNFELRLRWMVTQQKDVVVSQSS